jgi:hypothetical protein
MHLNSLILSLVLTWASLRSTHAMPTSTVVVELSACGMSPELSDTLLSQQVSLPRNLLHKVYQSRGSQCQAVCQAVVDAQKNCKRDASCICSAVLPDILQSCIQCSVDQISQDHLLEVLSLIPSRLRGTFARISLRSPQSTDFDLFSLRRRLQPTNSRAAACYLPERDYLHLRS